MLQSVSVPISPVFITGVTVFTPNTGIDFGDAMARVLLFSDEERLSSLVFRFITDDVTTLWFPSWDGRIQIFDPAFLRFDLITPTTASFSCTITSELI